MYSMYDSSIKEKLKINIFFTIFTLVVDSMCKERHTGDLYTDVAPQ